MKLKLFSKLKQDSYWLASAAFDSRLWVYCRPNVNNIACICKGSVFALNFKIFLDKGCPLNQENYKNVVSDFAKMRVNNFCVTAKLVSYEKEKTSELQYSKVHLVKPASVSIWPYKINQIWEYCNRPSLFGG